MFKVQLINLTNISRQMLMVASVMTEAADGRCVFMVLLLLLSHSYSSPSTPLLMADDEAFLFQVYKHTQPYIHANMHTQGLRRYASLGFFGSLPPDWSAKMVLYSDDPARYNIISMDSFFHTAVPYTCDMLMWLIRKAYVAFSAAKANGLTRYVYACAK